RSRITIGDRMLFGPLVRNHALPLQPHMTVRVNQSRHQPDSGGNGLGVADRLGSNDPVDYPEVAMLVLRQHHARDVQAVPPFTRLGAHEVYLPKRLRSSGGNWNSAIAFSSAAWSISPLPDAAGSTADGC